MSYIADLNKWRMNSTAHNFKLSLWHFLVEKGLTQAELDRAFGYVDQIEKYAKAAEYPLTGEAAYRGWNGAVKPQENAHLITVTINGKTTHPVPKSKFSTPTNKQSKGEKKQLPRAKEFEDNVGWYNNDQWPGEVQTRIPWSDYS